MEASAVTASASSVSTRAVRGPRGKSCKSDVRGGTGLSNEESEEATGGGGEDELAVMNGFGVEAVEEAAVER